METRQQETSGNETPAVKRVTTLADLDAMCREPVTVKVPMLGGNGVIEIEARRLTPAESARVNLIMRRAMPKLVAGEKPGQERFDLTDPEYFEREQKETRRARALAIYLAVPMFSQERPGLNNVDEIAEFVQSKLTEEILSMLFAAIVPGFGAQTQEAVNFFSSPGFLGS